MTIYKLNRIEVTQALADYISKKYHITEQFEAQVDIKIEGNEDRNALIVTVTINEEME